MEQNAKDYKNSTSVTFTDVALSVLIIGVALYASTIAFKETQKTLREIAILEAKKEKEHQTKSLILGLVLVTIYYILLLGIEANFYLILPLGMAGGFLTGKSYQKITELNKIIK